MYNLFKYCQLQEVNPMDGKNPPIGKNVLRLKNIQRSENYTCQAASKLALIENTTQIRVQGKLHHIKIK